MSAHRLGSRALAVAACGLAAATLLPTPARAVVTATFTVDSYKDWDAGEGESVLVTSDGEIKPGWATERTNLEFSSAWSAVRGRDGSVYIGSDDEGAIYRISGKKATRLATLDGAIAVVSLAVGGDGTLYAGTMPGGQVWAVNPKAAGKARKLVDLPDTETVWALAFGAGDKVLYAGTGPNGKLFAINPKTGKASVAFDTEDKRILSLAVTKDGAVWLGTSEKALVFRYEPERKTARAMADFDGNEVTALAAHNGGVVAAANKLDAPTSTGPRSKEAKEKGTPKAKENEGEKPKMPKVGSAPGADKPPPTNAVVPRRNKRKGKGALFRISADGSLDQLHALTATYFTCVGVNGDGQVFAGAGAEGRVYLVDTDDSVSTAFDVDERQVSAILANGKKVAFATADAAAFYRATGAASKSSYESKVFDAKSAARFGRIVWHGRGKAVVETRTGNTAEPGLGWSAWQSTTKVARRGGPTWGGRVTSPRGRYMQFRVKFAGDRDAAVRAVTAYHLPANRSTEVEEIEIEGARTKPGKLVTTRSKSKPRSPVLELEWEVDNPDGDATEYHLAVRRQGEVRWRSLSVGDAPLTKTEFEWNTETFPDGYYELRVTADDSGANSVDRARQSSRTTGLFLVDNTRPQLSSIAVRYPSVSARATDASSGIAEAAFSIDDGPWQVIGAADGLFDDLSEALDFRIVGDLPSGLHTLSVRVADEAGNIGSASVNFRVK